MLVHCLLACIVSDENLDGILNILHLFVRSHFVHLFSRYSLYLCLFSSLTTMSSSMVFFVFILISVLWASWNCKFMSFTKLEKLKLILSSDILFLGSFSLCSHSGDLVTFMLNCLINMSLRLCICFLSFFSLCFWMEIFNILSSSSLFLISTVRWVSQAKIKMLTELSFFQEELEGNLFLCLFQFLQTTHMPWLLARFFNFKGKVFTFF